MYSVVLLLFYVKRSLNHFFLQLQLSCIVLATSVCIRALHCPLGADTTKSSTYYIWASGGNASGQNSVIIEWKLCHPQSNFVVLVCRELKCFLMVTAVPNGLAKYSFATFLATTVVKADCLRAWIALLIAFLQHEQQWTMICFPSNSWIPTRPLFFFFFFFNSILRQKWQ